VPRRQPRPLHGIPIFLKDNIATADRLHTSAGSLAPRIARAARRVPRRATSRSGAVILGKANMTEWANFMTTDMPAGYSSRGGQVKNPYGESLSPGAPVAARPSWSPPASAPWRSAPRRPARSEPGQLNSVVGVKPTLSLISRSGIVPIAASQDTAGPFGRTVTDAAILLGAMTGVDTVNRATRASRRHAQRDYTELLSHGGLEGVRLGVPRAVFYERLAPAESPVIDTALHALGGLGAALVDPANIATAREVTDFRSDVMLYEFKRDLNRYLQGLGESSPVHSIRDLIRFNEARPQETLRFGQVRLLAAQSTNGLRTETYRHSRAEDLRISRADGVDRVMASERLDALVFPGWSGAAIGAKAGYPSVIVPAGYTAEGTPIGLTFLGRAWSEPTLLRIAHAFESATRLRRPPTSVVAPSPGEAR
jgi:amidase